MESSSRRLSRKRGIVEVWKPFVCEWAPIHNNDGWADKWVSRCSDSEFGDAPQNPSKILRYRFIVFGWGLFSQVWNNSHAPGRVLSGCPWLSLRWLYCDQCWGIINHKRPLARNSRLRNKKKITASYIYSGAQHSVLESVHGWVLFGSQ